MSGEKGSVQAKIKQEQPRTTYVCCVHHRLELADLDAIKKDNYLTDFELMINTAFLMDYQSSKLHKEFHDIAGILDEKVKIYCN